MKSAIKKVLLIAFVAVISFALGTIFGVFGVPALINDAVDQFYFHDHKVQPPPSQATIFTNGGYSVKIGAFTMNGTNVPWSNVTVTVHQNTK